MRKCVKDDEDDEDLNDLSHLTPTTLKNRYFKRYYYTTANFRVREEVAKRNLMKLEQRAKNFYKEGQDERERHNITCRNCFLTLTYNDIIDHALECLGVDRLIQFRKKVYHCPMCIYASHSRLYMIEHWASRHCNKTNTLYQCKTCNQGFERKAQFETHKMFRHQHKFEYYCFICNKSYHRGPVFRDHMHLHFGFRHQCYICGRNTTSLQNLRFHIAAIHWGDMKNHTCNFCGKRFALKKQLREHERVHTGYAPAKCKICNQTFTLFSNLNAHYNKHFNERKYKCPNCTRTFSYLSNLIRHRRIKHSSEQGKYVCNYCGKWYVDKRDYRDHVTVHLKHKKHEESCYLCNATFRIKKYLARHMKTHTTKYDCQLCSKHFKQKASFFRHMKAKHFDSDGIT